MHDPVQSDAASPSLALRPQTLAAMQAFARRRTRLLLARAILMLLLGLAVIGLLVALLDRARVLPEALRPWLSLLLIGGWFGYLVVLLFRPLLQGRSRLGLARMIEAAQPSLRESLVAAIELGQQQATGSVELRAALQERVASEMSHLPLREILPVRALATGPSAPQRPLRWWRHFARCPRCICLDFCCGPFCLSPTSSAPRG